MHMAACRGGLYDSDLLGLGSGVGLQYHSIYLELLRMTDLKTNFLGSES